MIGACFSICSLFFLVIFIISFFSKENFKNNETVLYKSLLLITFVGTLLDVLGFALYQLGIDINSFLYKFIAKSMLVYFCLWVILFMRYAYSISKKHIIKFKSWMFNVIAIIASLLVVSFPIYFESTAQAVYPYGVGVSLTYTIVGICLTITVVLTLENRKNIILKKYSPIFLIITLLIVSTIIQKFFPDLFLINFLLIVTTAIMYFTIENPDLKLLEEVHKSKEISDTANEEKTIFLYNMTQEIRNATSEIDDNADLILESETLDEGIEYAREIKAITSKFNSMTNEILDVSKIDAASVKVYNNKYNVKNILKEMVTMYSSSCKNKNIDFRVNIDHDVPEILYGDSINLKEVLTVIMDNSVKYTKEGFVEFNVNTVIKNDICRLMITIEDSGVGIKSEDINKLKVDNKSLNKANKLVTLMNGAMMVSSNYGVGTKVKIILDQKMEIMVNEDVIKYDEVYDDIKLLMVDDNDSGIKIIDKLIKGSNIKMDFATNGKECIDKIKAYERYDIILLDEQLSQISAIELIKKIKNIRNFNVPVILLTKDNNYEYNDEYKKLGFNDYLLKPVKKNDLLNKINEYKRKDK